MPSQENLRQKQAIIDEIAGKMEKAKGVVVLDYIGISVEQANSMREKLRDAGVDYKVYKNKLVKRAIDGTPSAGLGDVLEGPSAFAFGYEDATAPARVLDGVIKEFKKMEFKAGLVENVLYDAAGIHEIAMIPTRDVLIARFLGSVQSPIGKLVRTFAAIADDMGGGPEEAPAEELEAEAASAATEAPAEEAAAVEEAVAEAEPATEDAAPAEEAPADEAVEKTAPAEDAPADEAAEETAPAEEKAASAEDAPAEETAPMEEAPADEAAAEEENAADEAPAAE